MPTRRRDVLIAAGALGIAVALPGFLRRMKRDFEFEPLRSVPGFRRLRAGALSKANVALIGVEAPSDRDRMRREEVETNPCKSVFGNFAWDQGKLPIAVFTDYFCPYCPMQSSLVIELAEERDSIHVVWHDLPTLGPRSEAAAKVAVAAGLQDRYLPVHRRLMQTHLRPGTGQLVELAREFDLNETRLLQDLASAETEARVERTKAIAAVFGIVGTPAMIVGRTLVVGNANRETLERLIELELDDEPQACEPWLSDSPSPDS